jgi:regulator of RNase E activity RraA
MNAAEVLRIVDSLHREKNIDKEIVFGLVLRDSVPINAVVGTASTVCCEPDP